MKSLGLILFHVLALSVAFADEPAAAGPRQSFGPFVPLLLIFAIFYFLILRPQQKRQRDQQKFISELKRGDMVVTNSGIIGTVRTVSDKFVTLEVDDGVCIKMLKAQILENANNLKEENKAKAVSAQPQE